MVELQSSKGDYPGLDLWGMTSYFVIFLACCVASFFWLGFARSQSVARAVPHDQIVVANAGATVGNMVNIRAVEDFGPYGERPRCIRLQIKQFSVAQAIAVDRERAAILVGKQKTMPQIVERLEDLHIGRVFYGYPTCCPLDARGGWQFPSICNFELHRHWTPASSWYGTNGEGLWQQVDFYIRPRLNFVRLSGNGQRFIGDIALPSAYCGSSTGGQCRSTSGPYGGMVKPVALILSGAAGVIWSFYHLILFRRNQIRALLVLGVAWLSFAIGVFLALTEITSVFVGPFGVSATRYRGTENVVIAPVVIPELKFRDVQRQILAADLVEAAHDAALQQRPEAINALGVHHAVNVLLPG